MAEANSINIDTIKQEFSSNSVDGQVSSKLGIKCPEAARTYYGITEKIIRIIGFQGASRKYQQYLREDPHILFGHVGVQFEDDPVIYGFHPTPQAINAIGGVEAFLRVMKSRTPIPGMYQDDTYIFRTAYQLSFIRPPELVKNDPLRLIVYEMNFEFEAERYAEIRGRLISWYNQNKEMPYLLPPITANDPFDNCATIQRQLGIPVPAFKDHEGDMGLYILVFDREGELWKP